MLCYNTTNAILDTTTTLLHLSLALCVCAREVSKALPVKLFCCKSHHGSAQLSLPETEAVLQGAV